MIVAGQLLLADSAGPRCRLSPGFVRVEGEQIVEVVEGEIPRDPDHGGSQALISPGFIDAHLHLPQFDMIGAHGMPLLGWLSKVTFPAEMKWSDVDYARSMTERVLSQLVAMGTTGICAFATVHHDSAAAALQIGRDMGMRGVIGQVLMNREAPPELCRPTNQLIDEAGELEEQFPPGDRMGAAITPRFAIACSEDLLAGAADLARVSGTLIQSHLAETVKECQYVKQLFSGQSYIEVYRDAGLLGRTSVLGHGIHLDARDREALAETGTVIAHCPTANSFLRSGTMDRAAMVDAGVPIAIGSDIGAGFERSMVRVARSMIETASALGPRFPSPAEAWYAITTGNASVLGWQDAGRLQADVPADLVIIEPTIPWLGQTVDPLSMLVYAWDDRWVKTTMLRGEVC